MDDLGHGHLRGCGAIEGGPNFGVSVLAMAHVWADRKILQADAVNLTDEEVARLALDSVGQSATPENLADVRAYVEARRRLLLSRG